MSETTFVDFEIWLDGVQIIGYMGTDDQKLQWIGADGLECYGDFSKTNFVGETAHNVAQTEYLIKWCMIEDFLSKVDIRVNLMKHSQENAIVTYGNQFDELRIRLLINASEFDQGDDWGYDDRLNCFVKKFGDDC